jgi:FolB domain-containing protein
MEYTDGVPIFEVTMDKVIIKDILARGIIGVNDWEREKPQDILINIVIYTDIHEQAVQDSILDGIDYSIVTKRVIQHTETARRYTVEALAEDIAKICLEYPKVIKTTVRVEKPGAVRFSQSVGVEIERSRVAG